MKENSGDCSAGDLITQVRVMSPRENRTDSVSIGLNYKEPGEVAQAYNPNTEEVKAG